jgi:hypothetical protein
MTIIGPVGGGLGLADVEAGAVGVGEADGGCCVGLEPDAAVGVGTAGVLGRGATGVAVDWTREDVGLNEPHDPTMISRAAAPAS